MSLEEVKSKGSRKLKVGAILIVLVCIVGFSAFQGYRWGVSETLSTLTSSNLTQPSPTPTATGVETFRCEVCFSPDEDCKAELLSWLSRANTSIHVMIYSFTLDDIANALVYAYHRGVDVKVIMEKQQATDKSEYENLKKAGVPIKLDSNPEYMHHKVAVIDRKIVVTGSFNWSEHAQKNNENMIILMDHQVAWEYEREFEAIWMQTS